MSERAYREGRAAGAHGGLGASNPYLWGTPWAIAWAQGWADWVAGEPAVW